MGSGDLPPGKLGWPWLGESIGFLRDSFGFLEARFRRHGHVFKTRLLGRNLVCLIGPEAVELVNREPRLVRAGGTPRFLERLFGGETLPFISGDVHARRRDFVLAAFTAEAVAGYAPVVRGALERGLARWLTAGEVRAVDELDRAAMEIAGSLFFEVDAEALAPTVTRFNRGFGALPLALPFLRYGKALRARDRLRALAAERIAACDAAGASLLAHLVRAREQADPASRDAFAVELVHAFIVAQGAMRAGLVAVTRALGADAAAMQRARAAARAGDGADLDRVTREVRRYHKIIPLTGLSIATEELDYRGFRIPAGWAVTAILHSTMWDEAVFPEPQRLDPDRFAGGRPEGYVAHGAGPRHGHRCAGEPLADLVLATYLQVVLPHHGWELPPQDLRDKSGGFAPMPRDGLRTRYT
ncbi:MAG TPA: cytochrome P450 [Kofleriaceae bacterium]|nr:cytochrome P450 [Kofleriaceae bacterium]